MAGMEVGVWDWGGDDPGGDTGSGVEVTVTAPTEGLLYDSTKHLCVFSMITQMSFHVANMCFAPVLS